MHHDGEGCVMYRNVWMDFFYSSKEHRAAVVSIILTSRNDVIKDNHLPLETLLPRPTS